MARNISFLLTTEQILNRTKDVTRRLTWLSAQPGDVLQGCRKCMGLAKGEQVERLALIRIVSVRREPLSAMLDDPEYGRAEAIREGFPELDGAGFVALFCGHMGVGPETVVTRIEFAYLDEPADQLTLPGC